MTSSSYYLIFFRYLFIQKYVGLSIKRFIHCIPNQHPKVDWWLSSNSWLCVVPHLAYHTCCNNSKQLFLDTSCWPPQDHPLCLPPTIWVHALICCRRLVSRCSENMRYVCGCRLRYNACVLGYLTTLSEPPMSSFCMGYAWLTSQTNTIYLCSNI